MLKIRFYQLLQQTENHCAPYLSVRFVNIQIVKKLVHHVELESVVRMVLETLFPVERKWTAT